MELKRQADELYAEYKRKRRDIYQPLIDAAERRYYADLLTCMNKYGISEELFVLIDDWRNLEYKKYVCDNNNRFRRDEEIARPIYDEMVVCINHFCKRITFERWIAYYPQLQGHIQFEQYDDLFAFATECPTFYRYFVDVHIEVPDFDFAKLRRMQLVAFVTVKMPMELIQMVAAFLQT